jgi:hypothetical protein
MLPLSQFIPLFSLPFDVHLRTAGEHSSMSVMCPLESHDLTHFRSLWKLVVILNLPLIVVMASASLIDSFLILFARRSSVLANTNFLRGHEGEGIAVCSMEISLTTCRPTIA